MRNAKERNALPDICWADEKEVKALTSKQLRLYLQQQGLKVTGRKRELAERVLSHTLDSRKSEIEYSLKDCRYDLLDESDRAGID